MYKLDLHTHSTASPDGGLTAAHYHRAVAEGRLDLVAVTDHNRLDQAQTLQQQLGEAIIVGEEISTRDGHLIGLYLQKPIVPGLTAAGTADLIKAQNGLVYVPHPFERLGRHGLDRGVLDAMAGKVDIIEVCNGRAGSRRHGRRALQWARRHRKAIASSSDAHGPCGWTRNYSLVADCPTRDNLLQLLAEPQLATSSVGFGGRLHPTLNRLKKRFGRG